MDPYFDYRNKVDYDYVFKVNFPIKIKSIFEDWPTAHESQIEDACEKFDEQIEDLISDEDYNKEIFEDLGLGRVYPGVNYVSPDEIEMYFGISLIDAEKDNISVEDLEESIKEYVYLLDSNTDNSADVSGWRSEDEEVEPTSLFFKGPKKEDVKIELLSNNEDKKENLDKQFVSEGELLFENNKIILNEEGNIIITENTKTHQYPFSKKGFNTLVNNLFKEGYVLKEAEINSHDIESQKREIQQEIDQVEELAELQAELNDKVNELNELEEDKNMESFPGNDITAQELSIKDLENIQLNTLLNDEQKAWVEEQLGTIKDVQRELKELCEMIETEDSDITISLNEYFKELKDNLNFNLNIIGGI